MRKRIRSKIIENGELIMDNYVGFDRYNIVIEN